MNDEFRRPYVRLKETEDQITANNLLNLYITLYKQKFKGEPIFPTSKTHLTMLKNLVTSCGQRAYGIIEHYFEMKDEWFKQQAFSIDCLLNNLNKVNASYSEKVARTGFSGMLTVQTFCDACWGDCFITVKANHNFDTPHRCPECEKNNVPLKRVSLEERRNTILKLGAAFKELPENQTPS